MEKIAVWSDYDWCYFDLLEEYLNFKSDDYIVADVPDYLDEIDFDFISSLVDCLECSNV